MKTLTTFVKVVNIERLKKGFSGTFFDLLK